MRVKCINNLGAELSEDFFDLGYTNESRFDLTINHTYVVYALCLLQGKLLYLLLEESSVASWCPCVLFDVVENSIPNCWKFIHFNDADKYSVEAIFGYPEIVELKSHFDDLMERDEGALAIFTQRKKEIDQES